MDLRYLDTMNANMTGGLDSSPLTHLYASLLVILTYPGLGNFRYYAFNSTQIDILSIRKWA